MKTLELKQMENIQAGEDYCGAQAILSSLSLYSAVFFASGPVGWGLAGIAAASWWLTAKSCSPQI